MSAGCSALTLLLLLWVLWHQHQAGEDAVWILKMCSACALHFSTAVSRTLVLYRRCVVCSKWAVFGSQVPTSLYASCLALSISRHLELSALDT
eukprot:3797891-Rhodomonas_salina.1